MAGEAADAKTGRCGCCPPFAMRAIWAARDGLREFARMASFGLCHPVLEAAQQHSRFHHLPLDTREHNDVGMLTNNSAVTNRLQQTGCQMAAAEAAIWKPPYQPLDKCVA